MTKDGGDGGEKGTDRQLSLQRTTSLYRIVSHLIASPPCPRRNYIAFGVGGFIILCVVIALIPLCRRCARNRAAKKARAAARGQHGTAVAAVGKGKVLPMGDADPSLADRNFDIESPARRAANTREGTSKKVASIYAATTPLRL